MTPIIEVGRTRRGRRFGRSEGRSATLLLSPSLALFSIFVVVPLVGGLVLSMSDYDILTGEITNWGAGNYLRLVADPEVHRATANTLVLFLEVLPATIFLSFLAAVGLNARLRGRTILRTAYFLPLVSSGVAVATMFRFVFYKNGLLNSIISVVTPSQISFLALPEFAIHAVSVALIWSLVPLNIIFYLAALQAVPRELLDAAAVDGAGPAGRTRRITWPLVLPTTVLLVVIDTTAIVIGSFDLVRVLTQGGPAGSTTTLVYLSWQRAFVDFDLPAGAAIGFTLAAALLVATGWLLRYERSKA